MADLPASIPAGPLTDLLLAGSSVLDSHGVRQRLHTAPLTHDERLLLNHPGLMLLCPIRRSTAPASLLGLLLLGMRADLDAYHADDHRGLQRLIAAATLAVAREAEAVARARAEARAVHAAELERTKERNRLAREIHDGLGHYFTDINIQVAAVQALLDTNRPRALAALEKVQRLTEEGIVDVRRSVVALREAPLEHRSLEEELTALVEATCVADIQTTFAVQGDRQPLRREVALALVRIAQEGLVNIRKHARATHAEVHLDYQRPTTVRLIIEDNGQGAQAITGGWGLIGMKERAIEAGGTIQFHTTPGHGFRLEVELPR